MNIKSKSLRNRTFALFAITTLTFGALLGAKPSMVFAEESDATDISGVYQIRNINSDKLLDIRNGNSSSGENVQQYASNYTQAQYWRIEKTGDYYTIKNSMTGVALDVAGASKKSGANVQVYTANGTGAQQWAFTQDENGYYTITSAISDLALDVSSGSTANGANVQVYTANGTGAQQWELIELEHPVESGLYTIGSAVNSGYVLDVESGLTSNGAAVQIYSSNGTNAQKWQINYNESTGLYELISAVSGKVLDIPGGSAYSSQKLQQYDSNGTAAQAWAITTNADGSYTFRSALGCVLDIPSGTVANGKKIQLYSSNGTKAQGWTLTNTSPSYSGIYNITSALASSMVIDIASGSTSADAQVQIYQSNDTLAQKWEISGASDADASIYKIRVAVSGYYLTDNGSGKLYGSYDVTDASMWKATVTHGGIAFINQSTGRALDVSGGSSANATKVQTYSANGTKAQAWLPVTVNLINEGYYLFSSKSANSQVLDVPSGSTSSGTYLQTYAKNETGAQKWYVQSAGSGWYSITNANSDLVLDVYSGIKASGTRVWQYSSNNSDAQRWKFTIAPRGGVQIVSKLGNFVLATKSATAANGSQIVISSDTTGLNSMWGATATSYAHDVANIWNDNSYINTMRKKAVKWGDETSYRPAENHNNTVYDMSGAKVAKATGWMCTVDLRKGRVCVFKKSGGVWNLANSFNCYVGRVNSWRGSKSNTYSGVFTVHHKANDLYDVKASGVSCAKWWTCFNESYSTSSGNGTGLVLRKMPNGKYDNGQGFHQVEGKHSIWSTMGCIGMDNNSSAKDSKWIYDNVPIGSAVVVFGSYDGDKY